MEKKFSVESEIEFWRVKMAKRRHNRFLRLGVVLTKVFIEGGILFRGGGQFVRRNSRKF